VREKDRGGGGERERERKRKKRRRERSRTEEESGREKNDCFHDYNGERGRGKGVTVGQGKGGMGGRPRITEYGEQSLSANVDSWDAGFLEILHRRGAARSLDRPTDRPTDRPPPTCPPGNFVTARVMCVSHRARPSGDAFCRGNTLRLVWTAENMRNLLRPFTVSFPLSSLPSSFIHSLSFFLSSNRRHRIRHERFTKGE